MAQQGNTQTYVYTEVCFLQRIAAGIIPLEVLVTNVDTPLWTSENENISQATQAEAIAYVYWDIKRFLSHRCLCIIYRYLSFLLIVQGSSIKTQANNRDSNLYHWTNKETCLVRCIEYIVTQRHVSNIQTALQTKLNLGISICSKHHGCYNH